jgi:hypothetical protein
MVEQGFPEFPEWDPNKEYSSIARPSEYTTASGHRVKLLALHIECFLRGILEGHPDCWRALVLHRLPAKAKWLFPDDNGLVVKELVEGVIPRYVLLAEFTDYCSGLVVCWFADELTDLERRIIENIDTVDWVKQAVPFPDGEF